MRGEEFRARDKKVQKLGRDGLVEQNKATGEERRVSQRTADVSFGPERVQEQKLGRQASRQKKQQRSIRDELQSHRLEVQNPAPPEPVAESAQDPAPIEVSTGAQTSEQEAQPVMRDTRDIPIPPQTKAPRQRSRRARDGPMQGQRTPSDRPTPKRWQENDQHSAGSAPVAADSRVSPQEGRLRFEEDQSLAQDNRTAGSHRGHPRPPQGVAVPKEPYGEDRGTIRQAYPESPPVPEITRHGEGHPSAVHDSAAADKPVEQEPPFRSGRLRFEDAPAAADGGKAEKSPQRRTMPERMTADQRQHLQFEEVPSAVDGGSKSPSDGQRIESASDVQHLQFGDTPPVADSRPSEKQAQHEAKSDPGSKRHSDGSPGTAPGESRTTPRQQRLHFEDAPAATENKAPEGTPPASRRLQHRYEKAERRVEQASRKLDKAQAKLPTKRRAHLEKQYDSESGKVRRRLQFEKEVIPEGTKPALPKRAGGAAVQTAKTAVVMKAHAKLREAEHDNTGVEAAHKAEFVAERGAGRFLRWNKARAQNKPYRAARQAQGRLQQAQTRLAWQSILRDNPELQRKTSISKWMQKQKIKRKYAQAAREAQKTAQHTQNVLTTTGKIARKVAQTVGAHKAALALIALLALVIMLFSTALSSCTALLSGFQSTYIATTYLANEEDICNSDLYYTELETDLQMDIDATESNYPGYDEYRYNIGEISHDPYELIGYLSAAYDAFTFAQVKAEIERLFGEQYTLTRTPITETRYDDDNEPYEWTVLQTTLTVRPLSEIIAASLTPGDQTDRYGVYMQTYGNRQAYGNPFDFPWLAYVSSPYGWRIHPVSGGKNLHRGVDIAVAQGTPIHAVQDGRVVSAGNAGDYGLCVVIEDDNGYQSRYAHCSSISVTAGQEVKRGDVIAAVGSTGNSTGPHLHLEAMLNGEYLNPLYFVETGGSGASAPPGTPGGPEIPAYPGAPVTDATYAAMLEEAQKYLGYPYVWGGSSPSTSFDCSGYVSWVINHSGWDVGRRGAQGLFNMCTPVSAANAKPGDLIFFTKTYSAPLPVTHVGIYVGNGQMIHCGDPISYANINTSYWTQHFYSFGRLPT